MLHFLSTQWGLNQTLPTLLDLISMIITLPQLICLLMSILQGVNK